MTSAAIQTAHTFARHGSLSWFAAHEIRLAWRDWMSMMTAGKRTRERVALVGVVAFVLGLIALAYAMIAEPLAAGVTADKPTLVLFTGLGMLGFSLMLSQAIESVTRAFYTRADLDLILSSPAASDRLFAVRILAIVASTATLSLMMVAPFVGVAVWLDGARWLAVIPSLLAAAGVATSLAIVATIALFKTIGARRTRLVAQIVAAVVGAAFLIGTQIAAILSFGELSRIAVFSSESVIAAAPDIENLIWLPARAALGDGMALATIVGLGAVITALTIWLFAGRFATYALGAASIGEAGGHAKPARPMVCRSQGHALRAKEYRLLARDPWLVSQTLMQILYLLPPAVLLWQNYGAQTGALVVLAPVLVMAVGQLAGGLAWLAISGEDAPDLVATAPLSRHAVLVAKVQSVLSIVMVAAGPFVLAMALAVPWVAVATAIAVIASSASAMTIQLWFQTQARRAMFRRRQTASRVSTIAEAFSSISWAGAAALAAAGSPLALVFVAIALGVLAVIWFLRPEPV